jgi:hypothetical protein
MLRNAPQGLAFKERSRSVALSVSTDRLPCAKKAANASDVMDACFSPRCGHRSPREPRQLCADFVAKVS